MNKEYNLMTILSVVLMLFSFLASGCFGSEIDGKDAQKILNAFYNDNVPEPILDRHLLDAGRAIVPYLIVEIKRKDMPKRGYAILALGKISDRRALPSLIEILEDPSELIYFRDDAFRAIWNIDNKLGEEYAAKYAGKSKEIDRTIELLRKGKI